MKPRCIGIAADGRGVARLQRAAERALREAGYRIGINGVWARTVHTALGRRVACGMLPTTRPIARVVEARGAEVRIVRTRQLAMHGSEFTCARCAWAVYGRG